MGEVGWSRLKRVENGMQWNFVVDKRGWSWLKLVEGGWDWLNCFNHPKKQGLISVWNRREENTTLQSHWSHLIWLFELRQYYICPILREGHSRPAILKVCYIRRCHTGYIDVSSFSVFALFFWGGVWFKCHECHASTYINTKEKWIWERTREHHKKRAA